MWNLKLKKNNGVPNQTVFLHLPLSESCRMSKISYCWQGIFSTGLFCKKPIPPAYCVLFFVLLLQMASYVFRTQLKQMKLCKTCGNKGKRATEPGEENSSCNKSLSNCSRAKRMTSFLPRQKVPLARKLHFVTSQMQMKRCYVNQLAIQTHQFQS